MLHFIERTLGFSPDANSGSLELLLLALPILVVVAMVRRNRAGLHHTRGDVR